MSVNKKEKIAVNNKPNNIRPFDRHPKRYESWTSASQLENFKKMTNVLY